MRPIFFLCYLSSFVFFLTACASRPVDATPEPVDLIPYLTATPPPLQTPEGLVPLKTPLPTPTPFTYTVQAGDTMNSIALEFGVSLDDLQAANPEVSPNAMPVGITLKIPSHSNRPADQSTPTPVPLTIEQIECYPSAEGGMWCFVLVHNDFPELVENVSAQITLVDANGAAIVSQTAFLPLNILPPNTSLPLATFFSPNIPRDAKPQVQLLSAIRLLPNDERYLPAVLNNILVQVDADGYYAQAGGQVLLVEESRAASQVWVVAVAYDENGRVAGFRRWEGGGIQPGGSLKFDITVASLGGRMKRVEFAVEARP
ncbi:MAG TPA: LysM peptidoglycan-binding domain-containing protein [Anaerolineales bacterium]|nr:LysM peptidoglycan-binding domain-containing protein [Anaerolineales bacterium]